MRNRLIIHGIISLALIAAWVVLVYMPLASRRKAVDLRIQSTNEQLQNARRSISLLPVFLQTRERLQTDRADLDSRLFGKSEILELFREISIVADAHNIRLVEMSPPLIELLNLEQVATDTTKAPFLSLHLTLEGRFADFGRFVDEMEQSDFYRIPERCQIVAPRSEDKPSQYHFDFKALLGHTGGAS